MALYFWGFPSKGPEHAPGSSGSRRLGAWFRWLSSTKRRTGFNDAPVELGFQVLAVYRFVSAVS